MRHLFAGGVVIFAFVTVYYSYVLMVLWFDDQSSQGYILDDQSSQGYILVYSSYEEQTNGARNLWQLQMWAKTVKMKVVEPFAVNSMFGMFGAIPNFNQALRFSDYYDIDKWNNLVGDYGGDSLVQWEEFLPRAPHKAILLYTLLRFVEKPLIISHGEDDVKKYSPGKYEHIPDEDLLWFKKMNFSIARVVTVIRNEHKTQPIKLDDYKFHVFGNLNPRDVTLITINWIGIGVMAWRIQVTSEDHKFLESMRVVFNLPLHGVSPMISPSQRVLRAYNNYVSKYIGDNKYVGIVFRAQCVVRWGIPGNFTIRKQYFQNCSKHLQDTLDKVRNRWRIFLAYDLGTFGSDGYYSINDRLMFPIRDQILLDVFNGSIQMKQRDEMLIKAANGIIDRGFIAILEKTIAIHADCIVLLGRDSSFVQTSARGYYLLHPTNPCVVSICSEKFANANGTVFSSDSIADEFLQI